MHWALGADMGADEEVSILAKSDPGNRNDDLLNRMPLPDTDAVKLRWIMRGRVCEQNGKRFDESESSSDL